jgi:5-dehydro-4-deoxyglucarate dehydratase
VTTTRGAPPYSSAIFNLAPEFTLGFYDAVQTRDRADVSRRLNDFVLPYLEIRNRRPGYAVSIVKAGMRAVGRPARPGPAPLTDLTADELSTLTTLIEKLDRT